MNISYFEPNKTVESKSYQRYLESRHSNKYGNSSFWMDDVVATRDFSTSKSMDLLKMVQYQKAISNFVKLICKKDIPVTFSNKSTSYTDGKTKVVLAGDIKEGTFDATVGLALHEASHIVYTNFKLVEKFMGYYSSSGTLYGLVASDAVDLKLFKAYAPNISKAFEGGPGGSIATSLLQSIDSTKFFNLLNWIEDRRIDQIVFRSAPGYKSYYHALYEKYYLNPIIDKALASTEFRNLDIESYLFRVTGLLNPTSDLKALPGLAKINAIINLANINRLDSTLDAIKLSIAVMDEIFYQLLKAASPDDQTPPDPDDKGNTMDDQSLSFNSEKDEQSDEDDDTTLPSDKTPGDKDPDSGDEDDEDDDDSDDDGSSASWAEPLSAEDLAKLNDLNSKITDLINGEVQKKNIRPKESKTVSAIAESNEFSVKEVDFGSLKVPVLYIRMTKELINSGNDQIASMCHPGLLEVIKGKSWQDCKGSSSRTSIVNGLSLGTKLGHKIQIRDQIRDTKFTKLKNGKIDGRALYQAGYDIMSIFSQVKVDKYTPSIIDISIDASSSMAGSKWEQTITAVLAIAKAASMVQNVQVKISFRYHPFINDDSMAVLLDAYDSKRDSIQHLCNCLYILKPVNCTVDSLITRYQLDTKMITPGDANVNSYFINFSDGGPGADVGSVSYHGDAAHAHIKKCRKEIESLGVKVMSYFIDKYAGTPLSSTFIDDWGKRNSHAIDVTALTPLAKTINEMLLSK